MTSTATIATALGDPTRVRIVEALARRPLRTAELADATGMSAAALSRHLRLLRAEGLVDRGDVEDDGRGRVYSLRPEALDGLAGWLRETRWASALATASPEPEAREMLARIGAFLDAFTARDVGFFERHLRDDVVLVFPGASAPFDKRGCLDSVASHPPYRSHEILAPPTVRPLGPATSVITVLAAVATEADRRASRMFITAVIEDGHPWRLAHLQWTPADPAQATDDRSTV